MKRELSLRERMLAASSENEIAELLEIGASPAYFVATKHSRSRWRSAARKRRAELKGGAK